MLLLVKPIDREEEEEEEREDADEAVPAVLNHLNLRVQLSCCLLSTALSSLRMCCMKSGRATATFDNRTGPQRFRPHLSSRRILSMLDVLAKAKEGAPRSRAPSPPAPPCEQRNSSGDRYFGGLVVSVVAAEVCQPSDCPMLSAILR